MKKMKKGFTIVELVIVIGVIAILSAILIPTFTNLSANAKEAKAKQEVADAYTAYVVRETEAGRTPLKQGEVVAKHGTGTDAIWFIGDAKDGWKKGSEPSGHGTDAIDGNSEDSVDIYSKAA